MRRSYHLVAALAVAALAFAPSLADARAGFGSSMGSRGGRSYSAPPSTGTAPSMTAPLERSYTPQPAPYNGYGTPVQPGYGGMRSGFGSGLMGGLLGVGLGSLLFGHGSFFGGGGFGFIGLILQLVLLYFVGRWLFRLFVSRQPAMAGMGGFGGLGRMMSPGAGPNPGPRPMQGGGPAVTIGPADYAAFDRTLHDVQAAWSGADMRALQAAATPEMVSYFGEQLAEQASRGVRNMVTDVKLEKGDLAEAWSEGSREYATVAMRFSMLDVTRDSAGRVVDGDPNTRSLATEVWTFLRSPGGRWLLSAIQQAR